MRKSLYLIGSSGLLLLPVLVQAQTGFAGGDATGDDFGNIFRNILTFSQDVLIPFILGIGFLAFVWGMFRFFIAGGANEESRESGKNLMIYATLGFVFIIIFWGVINLLASSFGTDGEVLDDIPKIKVL